MTVNIGHHSNSIPTYRGRWCHNREQKPRAERPFVRISLRLFPTANSRSNVWCGGDPPVVFPLSHTEEYAGIAMRLWGLLIMRVRSGKNPRARMEKFMNLIVFRMLKFEWHVWLVSFRIERYRKTSVLHEIWIYRLLSWIHFCKTYDISLASILIAG